MNKSVRVYVEISYSFKWKWQHCVQIITSRFRLSFECDEKNSTALLLIVDVTKDSYIRYFIRQCLVMMRKFLLLLLQRKMRLTELQLFLYSFPKLPWLHENVIRREGLPPYIWRWFVWYKCSQNGHNIWRHFIALNDQEASSSLWWLWCYFCYQCSMWIKKTFGIWGEFVSKKRWYRYWPKFRLVHTIVVIEITLSSANMIWKVMLWNNIAKYSWVFCVMSVVWKTC